jgi:hypothetical protein
MLSNSPQSTCVGGGFGWKLVQRPLQSTPTHIGWCESDYIQTRSKAVPLPLSMVDICY